MNRLEKEMQSEHEAAFASLPWYVNGTLRGSELERVEQHLTSCVVCRGELAYQRDLSELIATSETFPVSPESGLRRILERIEAQDSATSHRGAPVADALRRLRRTWQELSPGVRGALLAQAAAILLLVGLATTGMLSRFADRDLEPAYQTLSDPAPVVDSRLRLHLVFVPDTPEIVVRSVVAGIGGDIVAGPSPLGVYTVATTLPDDGSETRDSLLTRLRQSEAVVFAEPAAPGGELPIPDGSSSPEASLPDQP